MSNLGLSPLRGLAKLREAKTRRFSSYGFGRTWSGGPGAQTGSPDGRVDSRDRLVSRAS